MRNISRKVFYFKIKEINLKNNKMYEIKYKQNKRKRNHKVKFFTIKQTNMVKVGPIIIIFRWPRKIKFDKRLQKQ